MNSKSKAKNKDQRAQGKDDDYKSYLTEGILRPAMPAPSSTEENVASLQILPDNLQKWVALSDPLPVISSLSIPNIYPILANVLGVDDYQYNMLSFWFVDILGEAIRIAQDELHLSTPGQRLMVAWFVNTLRAIKEQHMTREEVSAQVHLTILTGEFCAAYTSLGVPSPVGPARDDSFVSRRGITGTPRPTKSFQSVEMYSIAGLLWHIFANPFQYEMIKKAFCDTPPVEEIRIPYEVNQPKPYKTLPLPEKKSVVKNLPEKRKTKIEVEAITEEEKMEKIQREKDLYILPLQEAVNDNYFLNLFNVEPVAELPKKNDMNEKKKRK